MNSNNYEVVATLSKDTNGIPVISVTYFPTNKSVEDVNEYKDADKDINVMIVPARHSFLKVSA